MKNSLDLHGYKKDEVFDAVDRFVTQSAKKKLRTARIIPGKGKGIVKKELIRYLKLAGYSWKNEVLSNGQKNEGVFIVFID